jgi:succinoglycan biosynthesis protein ExoH
MPTMDASTGALCVGGTSHSSGRRKGLNDLDRRRINYLRLVLVLALVFLHYGGVYQSDYSPYRGYQGQELPAASIFISFMLFLGFTAVPAMSSISGFLFFQGANAAQPPNFVRKLKRRVASLVIPYLLWGTFFSVIGYGVHQQYPELFANYFSGDGSTIKIWANAILGITRTPLAFQLWFIHDLIITVAISPIIWILIGRIPWITLAVLLPLWILDYDLVVFHRLDVLLFFCFGAACAMHDLRPDLPKAWIVPVFALFLAAAMTRTLAPWLVGRAEGLDFDIATGAMRILGAIAVWNAALLVLDNRFARWVERNTYMAFYVHAAHYPPILFIKLALGSLIDPGSEVSQITLYLVTVGLTISSLIPLGRILERRWPRFFRVISGGRTEGKSTQEQPGFLPT